LNSQIRIQILGNLQPHDELGRPCEAPVTAMRLVAGSGEVVDLSAKIEPQPPFFLWLVARPSVLSPDMHYELQLKLDAQGSACACSDSAWRTVSEFTTGSSMDVEAPTYAGLSALKYASSYAGNNCGDLPGVHFQPASSEPDDASPGVRYNIYTDGMLSERYASDLEQRFRIGCGAMESRPEKVRFEVRAVDLAGNESLPGSEVALDTPCAKLNMVAREPELESESGSDAGIESGTAANTDAQAGSKSSTAGCSLARLDDGSAFESALLTGSVIVLLGRRRSAARSPA
jgi:hypothetical protein